MKKLLPGLFVSFVLLASSCGLTRDAAETKTDTSDSTATASVADPTSSTAAPVPFPDGEIATIAGSGLDRTVDGKEVKAVIAAAKQYEADGLYTSVDDPNQETYSTLNNLIYLRSIQLELEQKSIEVTEEDRVRAKQKFIDDTKRRPFTRPSEEIIEEDNAFISFIVEIESSLQALAEELPAEEGITQYCASHVLLETQEEATAVFEELEGGADFAAVAKEKSTEPAAQQSGGDLGCGNPEQYVQAFADAMTNATVGELVAPFESEFGWHVLLVEELLTTDPRYDKALQTSSEFVSTLEINIDEELGEWQEGQGVIPKYFLEQQAQTNQPQINPTELEPVPQ